MTDFIDPYPELPLMIDVGGMKYYMGNLKPVELAYRSRSEFKNTFGNNPRNEYILRKYMYPEIEGKRKLKFSSKREKDELIKILERRAEQLQESKEFTSSLLKNTIFQQSYLNIQKLIQDLKGKGMPEDDVIVSVENTECTKSKKYIKDLSEDKKLQLILELAWLLLHPGQVPKDIECSWNKLIHDLDTLRLGDIMEMIRSEQEKKNQPVGKPLNYLQKINISKTSQAPTIANALIQAKDMAVSIEDENAKRELENRIKILLNILQVKKYLNNDHPIDETRMNIIDTDFANKLSKKLISNPMSGGKLTILDKPLGVAMQPMYNYFKMLYDPVYSFLESSLKSSSVSIPGLLTLLHLCNNINREKTVNIDRDIYGIYRIRNLDNITLSFINNMLNSTATYLDKYSDPKDKNTFNKQIFTLPKVSLTTLLEKNAEGIFSTKSTIIPYLQFVIVDNNLTIPSEDDFVSLTKPNRTTDIFRELKTYFTPNNLYIIFTKPENASEDIPMNLFDINFDDVNVEENSLKIDNLDNNMFNKVVKIADSNNENRLFLDKLVNLKEYVTFNDAELALSIFIAFKELAPK
jgi:hypothetical protein